MLLKEAPPFLEGISHHCWMSYSIIYKRSKSSLLGPYVYRPETPLLPLKRDLNGRKHPVPVPGHQAMDVHTVDVMVTGDLRGYLEVSYDLPRLPNPLAGLYLFLGVGPLLNPLKDRIVAALDLHMDAGQAGLSQPDEISQPLLVDILG